MVVPAGSLLLFIPFLVCRLRDTLFDGLSPLGVVVLRGVSLGLELAFILLLVLVLVRVFVV